MLISFMFIHFNIQYQFNAVLYYYVLYNNYHGELKKNGVGKSNFSADSKTVATWREEW